MDVAIKVAGIHWWYKSRSHAAEMTAGYYNFLARDGYEPIAKMLRKRGVGLSFTCIEMSDTENPDARHSSPEREHPGPDIGAPVSSSVSRIVLESFCLVDPQQISGKAFGVCMSDRSRPCACPTCPVICKHV